MRQRPDRMLHGIAVPGDMFVLINGLAKEFAKGVPDEEAVKAYVFDAVEYAKVSAETYRALMLATAHEITVKYGFEWHGPEITTPRRYVKLYHPKMSSQERKARSEATLKRMGIPPGFSRVYGVDVPQGLAKKLRYIVVRRIKPDSLKYANPLRCVPRDLAKEFTTEALRRLVTNQDVSDAAMLEVAKEIVNRHGRRWNLKRKRP